MQFYGQRYLTRVNHQTGEVTRLVDERTQSIIEKLHTYSYPRATKAYRLLMREPSNRHAIAYAACNDRFFLLTALLRRVDALHPWIYKMCRLVESDPDDKLDLWARYHYKSTIITFAGSIQEIIRDPEITIAIFSIDQGMARKFLGQIKEECEANAEVLNKFFPDVFFLDPKKEARTWATDGITLRRRGNPKENTVDAYGLLGALPAGPHYALRIYDDVVTQKVTTQTNTDQTKKISINWQLSQNLGGAGADRKWHAGTRYSYADMYGELIRNAVLEPRLFPATANGKLTGKPVFLNSERWEKIKNEQRNTVAAQMLQNPLAGNEATFRVEHLRPYSLRPRGLNVYILGDPSAGYGRKSDRTAMIVIGIDDRQNAFLIDGYCHRMRLSERWENLKNLYKKWLRAPGVGHVRVGYERYGMQTDQEFFERQMMMENVQMDLVEVSWTREGDQSKTGRIRRLEPWFRNSRFWMPPKVWLPVKGDCRWKVVGGNPEDPDDPEAPPPELVYIPIGDGYELAADHEARQNHEEHLIVDPIVRIDEDRQPYDLTREFIEEYMKHPFGAWDDILDATSRIEDVEFSPPIPESVLKDLEPIAID